MHRRALSAQICAADDGKNNESKEVTNSRTISKSSSDSEYSSQVDFGSLSKPPAFKIVKEHTAEMIKEELSKAHEDVYEEQSGVDKHDFYLYRQPHLNTALWETKPMPYR